MAEFVVYFPSLLSSCPSLSSINYIFTFFSSILPPPPSPTTFTLQSTTMTSWFRGTSAIDELVGKHDIAMSYNIIHCELATHLHLQSHARHKFALQESWADNRPWHHLSIEKATSENLPAGSEDLALNLEICDQIRSKQVSPKDAAQALKRRIGHKNPNVQLLALGVRGRCSFDSGVLEKGDLSSTVLLTGLSLHPSRLLHHS